MSEHLPSPSPFCVSPGLACIALLAASACAGTPEWTPVLAPPEAVPSSDTLTHPLKAHLHSGELLVLDRWEVPGDGTLEGTGVRYDLFRDPLGRGAHRLPLDSVALFEASVPSDRLTAGYGGGTIAIAILGTVTGALTLICLADPKSCFGSCPTFYVERPEGEELVAEGFSASFARVLEERDVDAIPDVRAEAGRFEVTMRNEAVETHAVRSVRLLAARREHGERIVRTSEGAFIRSGPRLPPSSCRAAEGDCLAAVERRDGRERHSSADELDLATRETIELEFPAVDGPAAVVLTARHTLLSTFLFYQTLAYFGGGVGETMAALERGDEGLRAAVTAPIEELGGLEVHVLGTAGAWIRAGTFREAGPLASDRQAIVLPEDRADGPIRVRLELVQGYWRIDEATLKPLTDPVEPLILSPVEVVRGHAADPEALRRLLDPAVHLYSYPGDAVVLAFEVPAGGTDTYELFLESEGYYYEWMRPEWLEEEDPLMAALALSRPTELFRLLAPAFKAREEGMEALFWQSRFRGDTP